MTALVNEELYRQWRIERYVTIPKDGLFTGELSPRSENLGRLRGEFSPNLWRRISQAYKGDYYLDFDMPMPNGSIRTFEGRILNISDVMRLDSGSTSAELRLSVKESTLILKPTEGRARLVFKEERDLVHFQVALALTELKWNHEFFALEDENTIEATKKIRVTHNNQVLETPFRARIRLEFNGRKTVATVLVNAEEHPLGDVAKEQAQMFERRLVELMKEKGGKMKQVLMPISSVVASPDKVVQLKHSQLETTDLGVKAEILDAFKTQEVVELVLPLDSIYDLEPIIMNAVVMSAKAEGDTLRVEFEVLGPSEKNIYAR